MSKVINRSVPTRHVPNLDEEGTYLRAEGGAPNSEGYSISGVIKQFEDQHPNVYALETRHWEQGDSEWWNFIRKPAVDDAYGEDKEYRTETYELFNPDKHGEPTEIDSERGAEILRDAKDIWMIPVRRVPYWGDWSTYLTCQECRGALRQQDAVENSGTRSGYVHEACHPEHNPSL